jgi:hypothetical protein
MAARRRVQEDGRPAAETGDFGLGEAALLAQLRQRP